MSRGPRGVGGRQRRRSDPLGDNGFGVRFVDRMHETAKRAQRRYLFADHEDQRLRAGWLARDPRAPYAEHAVAALPTAAELAHVLVFKPDEIGDAVYALPALGELRAHLPNARLALVCRPLTRQLYERAGVVDEISTFEPAKRPFRAARRLQHTLAALTADVFDLAVFLRTNPAKFGAFLEVPARERLHPRDPRMRSASPYQPQVSLWGDVRRHQALQLLEIVGGVTGKSYGWDDVRFPEFGWTADDRAGADAVLADLGGRPYVVVHPFAKEEPRRYPLASWVKLIRELDAPLGRPHWVVAGGREDANVPDLPRAIQTQGRLSLAQTGYVLANAAGVLGNLSGPVHWSAALGTPTVTLVSGHSSPAEWGPLGRSLVIRADVPCAPCHRRRCETCLKGWDLLAPERITSEIVSFLEPHVVAKGVAEAVGEARA